RRPPGSPRAGVGGGAGGGVAGGGQDPRRHAPPPRPHAPHPPRGVKAHRGGPKRRPPLPAIPPLRSKRAPPWSPSPAPPFQGPSAGTPHPPQHATGHNCSIFKKIIEDQSRGSILRGHPLWRREHMSTTGLAVTRRVR